MVAKAAARVERPNTDLVSALAEAEARFVAANPKSKARAATAMEVMPGGNTRTVLHYGPFPLGLAGGEGCHVTDLDGHRYADLLGEYSAGLYGHSDPRLKTAIARAVDDGVTLGGPNRYEAELAHLMCKRFPSVERVRFCNSGTEGNLFAISTARMVTERDAILVFNGGYHGGVFYFGHHAQPLNAPFPWVMARYNDIEGTLTLIEKNAKRLAAIVIEPMMGGGGAIPADREFLQALRDAATKHGIILIFDEVMTSRLAPGGLQEKLGVIPDMTSFGKYLGGGMTFGAFGGRADLMRRFNPYEADAISHAGTFNNNVVSMAAGTVGLRDIYTPDVAVRHNAASDRFRERLNAISMRHGGPAQVIGVGSIQCVHFQKGPIRAPEDTWHEDPAAAKRQSDLQSLFHLDMLAAGQYIARRGYMTMSLPVTDAEMSGFERAFEEFLTVRGSLLN